MDRGTVARYIAIAEELALHAWAEASIGFYGWQFIGWTAHILEQYANNRLIRPRADYTGPAYPQRFVPLEQR